MKYLFWFVLVAMLGSVGVALVLLLRGDKDDDGDDY